MAQRRNNSQGEYHGGKERDQERAQSTRGLQHRPGAGGLPEWDWKSCGEALRVGRKGRRAQKRGGIRGEGTGGGNAGLGRGGGGKGRKKKRTPGPLREKKEPRQGGAGSLRGKGADG